MQKLHYPVLLSLFLLGGCGQKGAENPAPAAGSIAPPAVEKPKTKPNLLTPEQLAAIEATGKTGLWSDVTEVCADARPGVVAMLSWNVKDSYDGRVVVHVIDKDGAPRPFGRGASIGQRQTGPWVGPGMVFKLRAPDSEQDLADLTIGEKQC